MVNVGVILLGPIQYMMERAAELLEVKTKLVVSAAASVLRARQSAELLHTRSRQIMGKDLLRHLSSVDDEHIKQLTELRAQGRPSIVQGTASGSSAATTVSPALCLQPDKADSDIMPDDKSPQSQPPQPGDIAEAMRPIFRGQQYNEESETDEQLCQENQQLRLQLETMRGGLELDMKIAFV